MVSEALGVGNALEGLLELHRTQVINFEPSITLALDESCQLQCRLAIETRTNAYQVRTGEFTDDQISVYFTVRQYWGRGPDQPARSRRGSPSPRGHPADRPPAGAGHRVTLTTSSQGNIL